VDNPVVVAPFAGLAVTAEKNAHQPPLAPDPRFARSFSPNATPSRKIWRTIGTPAEIVLSIQGLEGKEE
jgi:hypothetical protein